MRLSDEYYHVSNRGAGESALFVDEEDYRRFLILLHIGNSARPFDSRALSKKYGDTLSFNILRQRASKDFVDILAYSLTKGRLQLILREKTSGGVESFMRKVATAYSMYFNAKYRRRGTLFQGRYQSKRIIGDSHLRYTFARVHLDVLELVEPRWAEREIADRQAIRMFVSAYPYSSYRDYQGSSRIEQVLITKDERIEKALGGKADTEALFRYAHTDGPSVSTKDRPSYQKEGITP